MKARLVEWRELAPETRHFVFEIPEIDELVFMPGQCMLLSAEIEGKTITSAYSIAGNPDGNRFEFCMNWVPQGKFSPHLFSLELGEELDARGPIGTLTWQGVSDSILVATGSGIAPFRAMLRQRLPQDREHRYHLIFGARHEHGLLYRDELEAVTRAYPNFRFEPTLTQPSETWTGAVGRVQEHLPAALKRLPGAQVYICGRRDMVNEIRHLAEAKGLDPSRIIYERYD